MTAKSETNRKARLEERRRQERARERRFKILVGGGIAIVVAGAATGIAIAATSGGSSSTTSDIAGVASYTFKNDHVTGKVDYPQTPPAGGPHNAVWLNCGIYPSPVPNENAVHALEHGAVWITYKPGLEEQQLSTLKQLAGSSYMVLSPYEGMASPITVTAWGKQLPVSSATDPRIEQFIAEYKQSKDAPEPGAACSGGTGTPE